jgi:hypothetical protein
MSWSYSSTFSCLLLFTYTFFCTSVLVFDVDFLSLLYSVTKFLNNGNIFSKPKITMARGFHIRYLLYRKHIDVEVAHAVTSKGKAKCVALPPLKVTACLYSRNQRNCSGLRLGELRVKAMGLSAALDSGN